MLIPIGRISSQAVIHMGYRNSISRLVQKADQNYAVDTATHACQHMVRIPYEAMPSIELAKRLEHAQK